MNLFSTGSFLQTSLIKLLQEETFSLFVVRKKVLN